MIGSCPECKEAIRIPEGKLEQRVRCPLCTAEYELASVFEKLPPMLELVGGNAPEVGIRIDSSSELDLVQAEASDSRPSASTTYRPQKRKQSSPLWEITKVVLGGALALPIGVLCVWWFAGRAPFGLSETVSQYVPWIVPEKLRKGDALDDSDLDSQDGGSPEDDGDISSSKQKANRSLRNSNQGGSLGLTKSIEGDPQKLNSSGSGDNGQLPLRKTKDQSEKEPSEKPSTLKNGQQSNPPNGNPAGGSKNGKSELLQPGNQKTSNDPTTKGESGAKKSADEPPNSGGETKSSNNSTDGANSDGAKNNDRPVNFNLVNLQLG